MESTNLLKVLEEKPEFRSHLKELGVGESVHDKFRASPLPSPVCVFVMEQEFNIWPHEGKYYEYKMRITEGKNTAPVRVEIQSTGLRRVNLFLVRLESTALFSWWILVSLSSHAFPAQSAVFAQLSNWS